MDLTTVIVLVLIAIAVVFLVLFEMNSRHNEARLKAESAARTDETAPSDPRREAQDKRRRTSRLA